MKIKFIDIKEQALSNEQIRFEYNKVKKEFTADSEGVVEFDEALPGTKITCFINPKDRQKFIFEEGKEISIVLIPSEVDMVFVVENQEGDSIAGVKVIFEYLNKKIEKNSDLYGQIVLESIPVNTGVKAYQLFKGEERNSSVLKCLKDKQQYSIILENPPIITGMRIKLVEKSGQAIKNADVKIKIGNKEIDAVSGQDGSITIEDVEVGSTIECKQVISGRMLPWHKLKCDSEIDEYILHGERPLIYNNYSDKIDSQVRMKFRLVSSKGIPIPNAVLKIEYGDKQRNKYSNQQGETMIDDVLIGDKIKIFVDIRGKNTESEFICQEDNEQHDIVLKTNKIPIYFWIIPLFVVIIFLFYLSNSGDTGKTSNASDKENIKKDTVIISNYTFLVKNSKTGKPVPEAKISLVYIDTTVEKLSDTKGLVTFAAFAHHLPSKYGVTKFGYTPYTKNFVLDSLFSVPISPDDSTEIDPVVALCGSEIQSKGFKTSIKTIKMNMPKGKFNIWYNLFNIPTKVDVYKGSATNMSSQNLIFSNKGFMKGIANQAIIFDSPDSLITISFQASAGKTAWVYKVFCAKIPVVRPVVPIVPIVNQPNTP